ncbi:hypothetical protein AVEN_135762-1 [Araneus ventricosus]|uniref:Uncharacterized protein n=1 Tax=Araneus ventricosus TaxID=182803 RepID=A0A4Y2CBG4_ARAVE|nr:hypothetical protein AVEN_135762-1 [Araneus ventricosus]
MHDEKVSGVTRASCARSIIFLPSVFISGKCKCRPGFGVIFASHYQNWLQKVSQSDLGFAFIAPVASRGGPRCLGMKGTLCDPSPEAILGTFRKVGLIKDGLTWEGGLWSGDLHIVQENSNNEKSSSPL